MYFNFISYLNFLLKSTNQHGVHSPFVFDYLTKCLYKKPKKSKDKTLDVLLKSISFFGFSSIKIYGNSVYEKEVKTSFPNSTFDGSETDMLFFESIQNVNPLQLFSTYNLHNNSLIVLNNINKNKSSMASWLDFIKSTVISYQLSVISYQLSENNKLK